MPTIELKFSDSRRTDAGERMIEDMPHYSIFKSVVKEVLDDFLCPVLHKKPLVATRNKDGHFYLVVHTCCDSFNSDIDAFLTANQFTTSAS